MLMSPIRFRGAGRAMAAPRRMRIRKGISMKRLRIALGLASLAALVACTNAPQSAAPASGTGAVAASPGIREAATASPAATPSAGVSSNAEALQELETTRTGYEQAQQLLEAGQRQEALDVLNSAYLDHFDRVEPWLDQHISQDYRTQVESTISQNLRRRLRDGAPDAEVLAQFPAALAALEDAESR